MDTPSDPTLSDPQLSDADLLAQMADSPDAFEALVRRHAPRVHALARNMVGEGSADDVVQEVFMSVYRQGHTFKGHGERGAAQFSTWLHRVALNACYGQLRRRQAERLEDVPEPVSDDDPVGGSEQGALRERLDWALSQLPRDQREAVALRELSGLEYAAIAEVLQVEVGTVKSRIARGRAALRGLLSGVGVTAHGLAVSE